MLMWFSVVAKLPVFVKSSFSLESISSALAAALLTVLDPSLTQSETLAGVSRPPRVPNNHPFT